MRCSQHPYRAPPNPHLLSGERDLTPVVVIVVSTPPSTPTASILCSGETRVTGSGLHGGSRHIHVDASVFTCDEASDHLRKST